MSKPPNFRLGRPPKGDSAMKQIAIRFPEEMLEEIDKIVDERYGQSDRTSIIRELVAEALAHRARPNVVDLRRRK
jgi:metal-responsive CopG/Arc/MetJ family transcriptional regulator